MKSLITNILLFLSVCGTAIGQTTPNSQQYPILTKSSEVGFSAERLRSIDRPQQFSKATKPSDIGFSAERLQRIDKWMQQFIDDGKAPNAVIFVARRGKIVYHKAFGYSNREKKTPAITSNIYRIASQTKALTSVTLMTLYEEGKFLLDDPISKYIPAFKNPVVLVSYDTINPASGNYKTRPAKSEITIRQLLSHNSGIPYETPLDVLPQFKIPYFNSLKPDKLEDAINRLGKRPLKVDPGVRFDYGLSVDVIGRLVEILSGKPLDVAIYERVTKPLGMNDTYFYLPENKKNRLVELYGKAKETDPITISTDESARMFAISGAQTYFSGGAGMVSTAFDYAKFCQMLLNGGSFNNNQILSRKTVDLMSRNQIGDSDLWRNDKFGLGFELITAKTKFAELASVGAFGWGGGFCSDYLIDPKEEIVLQVITNLSPSIYFDDFNQKLKILIYQALK
ncbi:serine hydrolase domain-containing protein [Flavobacterium sp. ZS1P14]|uniref:serine hydrolase domain-containing protein n=1 Tax=Flavobacterium sp. ZS1P14 TaxID=3401729 RepID=UPI003AAB4E30